MPEQIDKKSVVFLFGAGVSIPAGMPSTQSITNMVLSGENVWRHTNGNYYVGNSPYPDMGFPDEYVPRVLYFLKRIKREIDRYYNDEKYSFKYSTNYEDIYFMAKQIYDTELGEYDNPAVLPLINKMMPDIKPILIGKNHEIRREWELYQVADEATKYIGDIVWHMLHKSPDSLGHLNCLIACYNDDDIATINICTLNHDKVIEAYLQSNTIEFTDGFTRDSTSVRVWNPGLFEINQLRVRLFKLHGSVDWFRFRPENSDWSGEFIGIPKKMDIFHIPDDVGRRLYALDHRPIILLGTYNKMLDYTGGISEDIFYHFYKSLRNVKDLIICGYSFSDRGINTKIIDWIYLAPDNRILVIHPEPDKLKAGSRGSIRGKWDGWLQQEKLKIVPKLIEDTPWGDIKSFLTICN